MTLQYLTLSQVSQALHIKERTIKSMVLRGEFPPPVRLSFNRSVYDPEDIKKWCDSRKKRTNR